MSTSGNRTGYKIFSINTTVRNPKRNIDFLIHFKKFNGKIMNRENLLLYLIELVKNGIYKFTNIPINIKNKLKLGEELSTEEVNNLMKLNPQATGFTGRVMTQLRALKDQNLLEFNSKDNSISYTKFGEELIKNEINATFIYTKSLIGLHAKSPIRNNILNESRPFLNTIFVINEVNNIWKELGNEPKGILKHEFSVFVLSMKDCDYKKTSKEIIEYRKLYKYESNEEYIKKYLDEKNILPLKYNSIIKDYSDEVFRKFEMTGLIIQHGSFNYIYYNFSQYNMEKIKLILDYYKDYKYINFNTPNEYYDFLNSIKLPWENNEKIRKKIIEYKAKVLKMSLNQDISLDQQEEILDRIFYTNALSKVINKYELKFIYNELLILSGKIREESKLNDISEPLRLEYLLSLLIGKKYGIKGLISNIIYNEEGFPLHYAPSGKADIIYITNDGAYIFEPTMLRNRNQQLNSETTNIIRHIEEAKKEINIEYRTSMIAPYIHIDTIEFFQYKLNTKNIKILPLTIERIVGLFIESENIKKLNVNFDNIVKILKDKDINEFFNIINSYNITKNIDK